MSLANRFVRRPSQSISLRRKKSRFSRPQPRRSHWLEPLEARLLLSIDPVPLTLRALAPFGSFAYESDIEVELDVSAAKVYGLALETGDRVTLVLSPQSPSIQAAVD